MTYDDMVKHGMVDYIAQHPVVPGGRIDSPPFAHVDLATPTPPPTLWLADADAWRLYAGVEVEPVQDRFIEREMIKL